MLKNLQNEAKHIRLSQAEKAAMRAAIFGTPSPVAPVQSPYVFFSAFSYQMRMVMAGLLAFVLVGSGTASAAQGALPGDLLYPVKLSINEKVEEVLAPTPSAKAVVAARLAERRVEEAQALAAVGKLELEVAEELAVHFDEQATVAEELLAAVEVDDPGTAAQVKATLATSLSANGAILKKLGRDSNNKGNEERSDILATRVIARAEGPAKAEAQSRSFAMVATKAAAPAPTTPAEDPTTNAVGTAESMMFEADISSARPDTVAQKRAAALQEKAAEALEDFREKLKVWKGDAETVAQIEKELAAADTHMAAGASLSGQGEFAMAREEFAQALKLATRLEALFKADRKFNNGILKALINLPDGEVQGAQTQVEILVPEVEIRIDSTR